MNCKRCGRDWLEPGLVFYPRQGYCDFCLDLIVLEYEGWQAEATNTEVEAIEIDIRTALAG